MRSINPDALSSLQEPSPQYLMAGWGPKPRFLN